MAGEPRGTAAKPMSVPTNHRHGHNPESQRTNQRVVCSDGRLYRGRSAPVQHMRAVGILGSFLFLLCDSVDYRLRRLRPGYQPRRLRLAREDGALCAVPGVRTGTVGDVLRLNAGGG